MYWIMSTTPSTYKLKSSQHACRASIEISLDIMYEISRENVTLLSTIIQAFRNLAKL